MAIYITTESPNRYSHKAIFSKMLKFDLFGEFLNFQNWIFLSFLVFHQKQFFFELQIYFCFPPKISRLTNTEKILDFFGGGGGKRHYLPPPPPPKKYKIQKSGFANIVVKWEHFFFIVDLKHGSKNILRNIY